MKNKRTLIIVILIVAVLMLVLSLIFFLNKPYIYLDKGLSINESEIDNGITSEKIIEKINLKLLNDYYKDIYTDKKINEEANKEADGYIKIYIDWQTFGYTSKSDFIKKYKDNLAYEKLVKEYYLQNINKDDIKKYYDDNYGTYKVISLKLPKASDVDGGEVDETLYNNANNVLSTIKESNDILSAIRSYENDYPSDINIIKYTDNNIPKVIKKEIVETKDNSLCNNLIETEKDYYIFYRLSRENTEKYNEQEVLDYMVKNECVGEESNYRQAAFDYLRKKYKMKINDDKLRKTIDKYIEEKLKEEQGL